MSFPHRIKAKVWAELTMLRMKKKVREMAFQLCKHSRTQTGKETQSEKNNKSLSMESFIQDWKTK